MVYEAAAAAMASDASSPSAASSAARDLAKKKRGSRSAKLKQCKLDARREQWLSKVKGHKEVQVTVMAPAAMTHSPLLQTSRKPPSGSDSMKRDDGGIMHEMSDLDISPAHSPSSKSACGSTVANMHGQRRCASSGSSTWSSSCSLSDTEDENVVHGEHEDENETLDDWELAADALMDEKNHTNTIGCPAVSPVDHPIPACARVVPILTTREPIPRTRAWRADDKFRPSSLPTISKQSDFPSSAHCISLPPSSCPICCEDLDSTDSSFLPCLCGFRLCLFCHKRILEADGRCPGCRKVYNMVTGGPEETCCADMTLALSIRLSRSCSMGPRY